MAIPHRCSAGHRKALPQRITEYIRPPKCYCGREYKVDEYRLKNPKKSIGKPCNCDGWWFTHRQGSKGCNYRKHDED